LVNKQCVTAVSCTLIADFFFCGRISRMNERELAAQLQREGFTRTYVWEDRPNAFYPGHTHATETAHIILDGEMTLTMDGASRSYGVGDRCDVPAGAIHSARMGSQGCRYLIGER
jgi:mannose-6-phosphate isomerase-like protein (cupin superfamily)